MIINENRRTQIDVFTLSRFSGVFPFNDSFKCTQLSTISTFLVRFGMIFFGIFSFYYATNQRKRPRTTNEIASGGVTLVSEVLGVVILMAHNLILIRRRKLIKNCLDVVEDSTINKSLVYGIFSLTIKFILIDVAFRLRDKFHKTPEELYYLVIHLQMYMMVLQFCSLLSKIHVKMSTLVEDMTLYSADFHTHFELVDILRGLNKTFGWQLLVVVFQIFLHATISLYWIIVVISLPEIELPQGLSLIANIFEAGYRFYTLLLIIRCCTSTSEMAS